MTTPSRKSSGAFRVAEVQLQLAHSIASMRSGTLIQDGAPGPARADLEGLAATLPDLFGTLDAGCLDRIAERFGGETGAHGFTEILVISEHHVHVIQPLAGRPGTAFVAVSPATSSVGLVLSAVRAEVAELEGE